TTAAMSWFPPRQRATVVGLKQVGLPFGGMLGAALMPALALRLGWRWAITAGALAIVACAALCATVYRDPTGEAPLRRAAGQPGRGTMAPRAARARVRLLRHRLERRAAHPHGRARRAALGRHRGRARARHLLARRDARPARLRLVPDGGGRLSRPVDRPLARDAGGARSPRARPRARAGLGACRNRGAP